MAMNFIATLINKLLPAGWKVEPTDMKAGRQCPAGHPLDPSWQICPYCHAKGVSREKSAGFKTRVEGDEESTTGDPVRKLRGALVTFSSCPEGQLFPVYEGKNLIGSSSTSSDRRPCDVQITTDPTVSREHALIRCLKETLEIFDQKSENGTYMNGQRVPVHGMPLVDQSWIKTGKTVFRFLKIEPPENLRERAHRPPVEVAFNRPEEDTTDAEPGQRPIVVADAEPDTPVPTDSPPKKHQPAQDRHKRPTIVVGDSEPVVPPKDKPTSIL